MLANERVTTIMSQDPVTVRPGQSIAVVQKLMVDGHFHHVPVVDGNKLLGMVSAIDLTRASYEYASESGPKTTVVDHSRQVAEIMQPGPVTVKPTDSIRHATEVLAKDWFHALPVVDGQDELVGIVTTTDILRFMLEQG